MTFRSRKHPKFREVMASKSSSRMKILCGSAFMSVAVILYSSPELFIVFTLASVGIFLWDINSQTNSGVEIEKKFEKLEQKIEELENNSKSDNQ